MNPLEQQLQQVKKASQTLPHLSLEIVTTTLLALADASRDRTDEILEANGRDMARLTPDYPLKPRLELTVKKIEQIAEALENVARLPSPIHHVLESRTLPNGLELSRVSVPLGVVGIIFEARPNVTVDVFSLCFKSGNGCVLKGGSDAYETNRTLVQIIKEVLESSHIDPNAVHLLGPGHAEVEELLCARNYIDVIIPRGGQKLIEFVRQNSAVPIIETGAGVVHTYVDANVNEAEAATVIYNAKTNRPTACNALDTLLIHAAQLKNLPALVKMLGGAGVKIHADKRSFSVLENTYPKNLLDLAREEHFGLEFLGPELAIKTVNDINEALTHLAAHSSKHSEAILSTDPSTIKRFLSEVDAAVVYANASTALSDGGVFGLGAEVGISTQKLHARGPMGLPALTTYKWVARGNGQIRE